MDIEQLPPTISVEKAAELIGLSRSSAYRAAGTGELPVLRFGRRMVVPTHRLKIMLGYADDGADQLQDSALQPESAESSPASNGRQKAARASAASSSVVHGSP